MGPEFRSWRAHEGHFDLGFGSVEPNRSRGSSKSVGTRLSARRRRFRRIGCYSAGSPLGAHGRRTHTSPAAADTAPASNPRDASRTTRGVGTRRTSAQTAAIPLPKRDRGRSPCPRTAEPGWERCGLCIDRRAPSSIPRSRDSTSQAVALLFPEIGVVVAVATPKSPARPSPVAPGHAATWRSSRSTSTARRDGVPSRARAPAARRPPRTRSEHSRPRSHGKQGATRPLSPECERRSDGPQRACCGRGPSARSLGRLTLASAGQSRRDVSVHRDDCGSSIPIV
jgi:hypothetical protein